MAADTGFPALTEGQSDGEKIRIITNYLYMLLEQLRYTNANMGVENFSESGIEDLTTLITEPVYAHLTDTDGRIADLTLTAQGLSAQLTGVEGQVTALTATADGLTARMSDAEGNISTLSATAAGLQSRVTDAEGNISTLSATAAGLQSRVTDAEGDISTLSQTVNGMTLSVSNQESQSTIRLMANGVQIGSAGVISMTGLVAFSDLENAGYTTINGANITTGTITGRSITAADISGSVFRTTLSRAGSVDGGVYMYYLNSNYLAGGLRLDDGGAGETNESRYRLFLYTNTVRGVPFALKLYSAGNASLESENAIYISAADYITLVLSGTDGTNRITVGATGQDVYLWGNVYINGVKQ